MNPLFKTPEFKVGVLVLVVSGLIGVMSVKVSESSGFIGGKKLWFKLDNAAGLLKNGAVHVAGIRVGAIEEITLAPDGKARIDVVVQPDVKLSRTSKVQIRANGILGDKQVEIIPGDVAEPMLESGQEISGVDDSASLDNLIGKAGKIADSLAVVAENLKDATEGDDTKPVGKILKNVEMLTADLSELVRSKKGEVAEIITTMKSAMARIDRAMVNVEEISQKINEGKGTIGRLINDEELVDQLDTTLTTFGNFADTANKLEVAIEGHTNIIPRADATRSYLGVQLRPGSDRFYEVAMVSAPEGPMDETTTTTVINNGPPTTTNEKVVRENEYKFTAMFGKNFYDFGLKAGLIENSGGLGVEYHAFRRKLKLGVDAFDFEEEDNSDEAFKLRPYIRYTVMKGVYIQGGGEDMLNERSRSVFFGGGVLLTSDDLKALISRVSL